MKIVARKKSNTLSLKLSSFIAKLTARKVILFSIIFITFFIFSFGLIIYGATLQKNQTMSSLAQIIANGSQTRFLVFRNYILGVSSDADMINIDMDFKGVQLLNYARDSALNNGIISEDLQDISVKAKLNLGGESYKVKLSPTGMNLDMIGSISKRGYKVKVLEGRKIYGMSEFKLLPPQSRHNMVEWVGHELEKKENLIALKYFFLEVTLNGDNLGVYAVEEHFNKELLESNRAREGIIFAIKNSGDKTKDNRVRVFNEKKYLNDPTKNNQIILLKSALQSITNDDLEIERFFDLKKYAKNFAIIDLMGSFHAALGANTFYYLNPVTTLVEPITREYNSLRYSDGPPKADKFLIYQFLEDKKEYLFANKLFDNKEFVQLYLAEMVKISDKSYLDNFFDEIATNFSTQQNIIFKGDPFYKFPKEYMYERQSQIINWLNRDLNVLATTNNKDLDDLNIKFRNNSPFPIQLTRLHTLSKEYEKELSSVIQPGEEIMLPIPSISINKDHTFIINYKIFGIKNSEREVLVVPKVYSSSTILPELWNTTDNYLLEHNNIIVDQIGKTISFADNIIDIKQDIFIPENFLVEGNPGLVINLLNGASIYSKSAFKFIGTSSNQIKITSSDNLGGGLAILSPINKSIFENTIFEFMSSPNIGTSGLSASISIYDTSASFNSCIFQKNRSEDFLNLIQSEYNIIDSYFRFVNSDAIDSDFSTGTIKNTSFDNIGNDALDFSGSSSELNMIKVGSVGDKAISAGENSTISGMDISIIGAEIGITSKDLSRVDLKNVNISNTRLGFAIFKKKEEFGPGFATINNLKMIDIDLNYLIDQNSSLFIDDKEIIEKHDKVADLLYGSIYGKSSK